VNSEYEWKPYFGKDELRGQIYDADNLRPALSTRNTPLQRQRAVRFIASHADSAEDCAKLLDMLGLHASEGKSLPGPSSEER